MVCFVWFSIAHISVCVIRCKYYLETYTNINKRTFKYTYKHRCTIYVYIHIGAMLSKEKFNVFGPGDHASTYG